MIGRKNGNFEVEAEDITANPIEAYFIVTVLNCTILLIYILPPSSQVSGGINSVLSFIYNENRYGEFD